MTAAAVVRAGAWLRRRAENVLALMLGAMFLAFVLQIVFRYFMNWPTGWTSELTVVMWLWMVLWGAVFVLRDDEEIRFDLFIASASRRRVRVMGIIAAVAIVVLYVLSLKGTWAYVSFMKVERSSYLKIRLDYLYSIYLIFLVAAIVRFAWGAWRLWREPADGAPPAEAAKAP
jgi:TRAP-type C4-dicarboxylate transport system permease small subunit